MLSGPNFMIDYLFYVYTNCLEESLINRLFSWEKINIKNEHQKVNCLDTVIKRWITSSDISLKFYFHPNNGYVITSFWVSPPTLLVFSEVFRGAMFQLINFAVAVADGSPSIWPLFKMIAIFETLHYLIPKFQLCPESSVNEATFTIQNRLGEAISDLFLKLNYLIFHVPTAKQDVPSDSRHHPKIVHIMSYPALEHLFECECKISNYNSNRV